MQFINVQGIILKDGTAQMVTVEITPPRFSQEKGDFYCGIKLEGILHGRKRIYGINGKQARKLCIEFANEILRGHSVMDNEGRNLVLRS